MRWLDIDITYYLCDSKLKLSWNITPSSLISGTWTISINGGGIIQSRGFGCQKTISFVFKQVNNFFLPTSLCSHILLGDIISVSSRTMRLVSSAYLNNRFTIEIGCKPHSIIEYSKEPNLDPCIMLLFIAAYNEITRQFYKYLKHAIYWNC